MLTPIIPLVRLRASRISALSSSTDKPLPAIMPIPPSSATAAARGAMDILTAIPPWITGILATKFAIRSTGIFTIFPPI